MGKVKIGINGFGRIGRLMLRASIEEKGHENIQVVAINDPFLDIEYACYLYNFDSIHGRSKLEAKVENGKIKIGDNLVEFYSELNPENIGWDKSGATVIAEATGKFTALDDAKKHIVGGAKKVVITAPGKKGVPMFVMGVNEEKYAQQIA